ncbi:MAG: YegS/Rv2252/BmrU family lipid kinase [Gemmatimonadota bacterium]
MHIEIIVHSANAGALEQLRSVVALLRERSHEVYGRVTFERGDAERFASEATERGADLVIAAGGDGTLNEVANGLLAAAGGAGPDALPRLGVAPLGTANDLAAWLEMPLDPAAAVLAAVDAPTKVIDVARINERYFVNVSSGGFGAEATEEAPDRVKRALGTLAYVVTGARKFASLQPSQAHFSSAGQVVHDGEFLLFAVGNGRRTGGGNWLTPRADLSDGLLDFCLVRAISHAEFLRLLPDLRSGAHIDSEHVLYRQLPELTVRPAEEISVNADGEPIDASEFVYAAIPSALRLAAPVRLST